MEHASRIHVDPEMPSHDAEGLHLELTSMNGSSTKDNDEWRQKMGEDNATKRPSNEKLLVRIVRV
jgi:hypothetical protein